MQPPAKDSYGKGVEKGYEDKTMQITKEDVEAAYREGWSKGYADGKDRNGSIVTSRWNESDTKKKLEGKG